MPVVSLPILALSERLRLSAVINIEPLGPMPESLVDVSMAALVSSERSAVLIKIFAAEPSPIVVVLIWLPLINDIESQSIMKLPPFPVPRLVA